MKKLSQFVVPALALFLGLNVMARASSYVPNEVIVKFKKGALRTSSMMAPLYQSLNVRDIYRYHGTMNGLEHLKLDRSVSVEMALTLLNGNSLVEYAQPNYILSIPSQKLIVKATPIPGMPDIPGMPGIPCIPGMDIPNCDPNIKLPCLIPGVEFPPGCQSDGSPSDPSEPTPAPTDRPDLAAAPAEVVPAVADPNLDKAWGIGKVGATTAWTTDRGSKDIIVADIDTGIDYNHEDLAFNVWRNPSPTQNDIVGFDFVHNDGLPFDDNEHGTHTAGTIGAVGGNGIGISGVAQKVSIMSLKFLSGSGSGTTADAVKAIDYAIEHGAKVLSNSWGGPGDDDNKALFDSIERAKAKDVLFIAAAGNDGVDNDGADRSYPAGFDNDNLISVAATGRDDKMAYFSNYGHKSTHLAAPGVDIYSTVPGNNYATNSGTSMACPHVAGAAALVWSHNPTWNYKQVKEGLLSSVDKLASLEGKTITGGRINLIKALQITAPHP